MAVPTVIKWTDAGVPQLRGVEGAAIAWLDYILVTRLGWTKEFSGTNKAVYRAAAGLRRYYRVDDTAANSTQGVKKFKIESYESMVDVDTGAGYIGPEYIYKSTTVDTTARPWVVIGDSAGFYSLVNVSSNDYAEFNYQGDGIPFFSTDSWFSIISGRGDVSTYLSEFPELQFAYTAANTGGPSIRIARRTSGDVSTINTAVAMYTGGGLCADTIMGSSSKLPAAMAYPVDGKLIYTRPFINDGVAMTMRGYLPGLYCPEHGSGLTHLQTYSAEGKSFLALKISYYGLSDNYLGWVLIDIGDSFR